MALVHVSQSRLLAKLQSKGREIRTSKRWCGHLHHKHSSGQERTVPSGQGTGFGDPLIQYVPTGHLRENEGRGAISLWMEKHNEDWFET